MLDCSFQQKKKVLPQESSLFLTVEKWRYVLEEENMCIHLSVADKEKKNALIKGFDTDRPRP